MCLRALFTSALARFAMVFVLLGASGFGPVQAQNVLMLATAESAADAVVALNNMQAEFAGAGATVTRQDILTTAGAVTPTTFTASPGLYDIVLVATVYNPVAASNWDAIDAAIASRAANSFVMFVDGCCQTAANIGRMRTGLAAASGFALTAGADQRARDNFPLNTNSLYQGFFTASLPQINGGWAQYIAGVPTANALYLPAGTVAMPAVGSTTSAYGLFLPITQSYAGAGACVFAVNDISPFDTGSYPANQRRCGPRWGMRAGCFGAQDFCAHHGGIWPERHADHPGGEPHQSAGGCGRLECAGPTARALAGEWRGGVHLHGRHAQRRERFGDCQPHQCHAACGWLRHHRSRGLAPERC